MKHLVIRNFGPVKNVDIHLGKVNVLIGMQSSGKSCVLKTACYCAWVEKRLELSQKVNGFGTGSAFVDIMIDYYQMSGYLQPDTYIEYETSRMRFSYNHSEKHFDFKWKRGRWQFRRYKVSYIPADRNIVAAIPGWNSLSLDGNMLEFMSDWDKARRYVKSEDDFLGLGLSYTFDRFKGTDNIRLEDGTLLKLKASSSGIQSLLPMYVHLDFLTDGQYRQEDTKISYEQREERRNLLSLLYANLNKNALLKGEGLSSVSVDGSDFLFDSEDMARQFKKIYEHYTKVHHSEIFLEEPEENLFPTTQCQFVNWILDRLDNHGDVLFVATHSPYILNQIIKDNPKDLSVMFTHRVEGSGSKFTVRQFTDEEIREVYDNGVDVFFNFEMYV